MKQPRYGFLLDDDGLQHLIFARTLKAALKILEKKLKEEVGYPNLMSNEEYQQKYAEYISEGELAPTVEEENSAMRIDLDERLKHAGTTVQVFEGNGSYFWKTISSPEDALVAVGAEQWAKIK